MVFDPDFRRAPAGQPDPGYPVFLRLASLRLDHELEHRQRPRRSFVQHPAALLEFARVDAEACDLVQAEITDSLTPDLRSSSEQRLVDPHLLDVAREPDFGRLKLRELILRQGLPVQRNRQATLVVATYRNLVDADARSRPDFAHGGADQGIDAGGVAQRSRRAQFRQELAARAFQRITGSLVLLGGDRSRAEWSCRHQQSCAARA